MAGVSLREFLSCLEFNLHHGEYFHLSEPLKFFLNYVHPLTDPKNEEMLIGVQDDGVWHELLDDLHRVRRYNARLHGVHPGFP